MALEARAAVKAWKPAVPGIREVLHAHLTEHAYPPHTHDTWTVFIVDAGRIRYDLDRHGRTAGRSLVSVLPPHVVHDGRPATPSGYSKRVLYLESSLLPERLIGAAVDRPELPLPAIRGDVSRLHDLVGCMDDALEAEIRLGFVAERIREALGDPPREPSSDLECHDRHAEELRAHLDAHLFEPVTMADAAARVGVGPTQLARAFTRAYAIAPHRYVLGRRLDEARDRILRGQNLADVAAEVGFVDQAHLTRRFRQFLGTTPARFAGRRDRVVPDSHARSPLS